MLSSPFSNLGVIIKSSHMQVKASVNLNPIYLLNMLGFETRTYPIK